MKNIIEILKGLSIEIPEDLVSSINKEVSENYKTVAEFEKKVSKLEGEIEREKSRADSAEETLKGFDGKDFEAISKERDEWKTKAEQSAKEFEEKEQARIYAETVKETCKDLKFSSKSAEKAFISALTSENLKVKDGSLLGFSDFLENYKKDDPKTFENEAENNQATFTAPLGTQNTSNVSDDALRKAILAI